MEKVLKKEELMMISGGEDYISYPEVLNSVGNVIGRSFAKFICGLERLNEATERSGYRPATRVNQKNFR